MNERKFCGLIYIPGIAKSCICNKRFGFDSYPRNTVIENGSVQFERET